MFGLFGTRDISLLPFLKFFENRVYRDEASVSLKAAPWSQDYYILVTIAQVSPSRGNKGQILKGIKHEYSYTQIELTLQSWNKAASFISEASQFFLSDEKINKLMDTTDSEDCKTSWLMS